MKILIIIYSLYQEIINKKKKGEKSNKENEKNNEENNFINKKK